MSENPFEIASHRKKSVNFVRIYQSAKSRVFSHSVFSHLLDLLGIHVGLLCRDVLAGNAPIPLTGIPEIASRNLSTRFEKMEIS